MKLIHLLVFLVSGALLIAVIHMAQSQDPKSPREILEDVRSQLERGEITRQEAIHGLDAALQLANEKPRPKLLADLHMERGEVFLDMGGYGKAGEDFKLVLDAYRPGDRRAETLLVDVDIASGDYESAEIGLRKIIAKRPRDARAWVQFGRLGKLTAEAEVEKCYASISDALVPDDAMLANKVLLSIAARDPRDPSRVALIRRLHEYFSDDDKERTRDILDHADSASRAYRQARSATARSLQTKVTADSATQMMELFSLADRDKLAVQLGALYLADGHLGTTEEPILAMLRGYEKLGQHKLAGSLISPWLLHGKAQTISSEEFFRTACDALYRARSWGELAPLAGVMRRRGFAEDTARLANLYQGIGIFRRGGHDEAAIYALSRFFAGLDHEIFPNSRALGYHIKALAQRNLKDAGELESLLGVFSYDPDCDAKVNLRISRLMQASPNRGAAPPLYHLTVAMSKDPKLVDKLMPEWIELGESEIATSTLNMASIYARLKEAKTWVQQSSGTPYRKWQFGKRFIEDEEWVGLNASAKSILQNHPGFLPAIDQRIEAELQLGNVETAVELVLRRVDLIGIDEQSATWLERVPEAGKTNERLLRLMTADPAHTGRLVVARTMIENGELQRAEEFLAADEEAEPGDVEQQLLAETKMQLGRHAEAAVLFQALLESDPESLDLLLLRVQNEIMHPGSPRFDLAFEPLLAHTAVTRRDLLVVVDELIRHSKLELALSTLEQIDEQVELRHGEFLMRSALVQMLLGDDAQADWYLERADAFEDSGEPELARVFQSLSRRDWPELAAQARLVSRRQTEPSPTVAVILAILSEDLEEAEARLKELVSEGHDSFSLRLLTAACRDFLGTKGLQLSPINGKLTRDYGRLLRGSAESPRDPREALGILLASESPGWMPWARAQVEQLEVQIVGPLWPMFLKARVHVWENDLEAALQRLTGVHLIRPEFVPAWKLHQVVLARKLGGEDNPEFREFRMQRAQSLGGVGGNFEEAALAAVVTAFGDSGPERALELSLQLVEDFPEWAPGYESLAKLQANLGLHREAVSSWASCCTHSYPASNLSAVPELLASLDAAQRNKQAPVIEELFAILENLANHLPHDPLIALRLAELDIEVEAVDPAAGVDRAFARLDRFRANTDKTLNYLRPQSGRKWIDFIVEIDTGKAEELIESELLRRPGELDLWLLRTQIYRARGELDRALESCNHLLRVSRDTSILREQASLLALSGSSPVTVVPLLNEIGVRSPESTDDPSMILTRVRAVLNMGKAPPPATIALLRNIWVSRRSIQHDLNHADLGYLYIQALLLRDGPRDRTRANKIAERLLDEGMLGWYDRAFFKAILGIANAKQPDASEEPAASN